MNKIMIMGRLAADPVCKEDVGERHQKVANYSVYVDRRGGSKENSDIFKCCCFDNRAEFAEKYLKSGMKVIITGRVSTGSYTNKDGVKIPTFEIIVEDQEFAERKRGAEQSETESENGEALMPIPEAEDNYGYSAGGRSR